ncbi:MAG: hypothetical protein HY000_40285 [Planctomycetes bacterium]|nr:hypothetical protein [Planctomycetota bacterium]
MANEIETLFSEFGELLNLIEHDIKDGSPEAMADSQVRTHRLGKVIEELQRLVDDLPVSPVIADAAPDV